MSTLRISDAPLLPDVDGTEKIPTGGRGDYAISVDQIKGHIFQDIGKELVGLGDVDNTSDLDKPVSTAQQAALDLKANKTYVDTNLDLKADKTNVYTRSETTLALSKKADLVNGVVPENQIPSSFNDVLEFTTPNLPLVGEGGKIYVTTDTNKTWRWATNKYVEISGWNPDSVSKSVTLPTYYTKEAGVDPVTGVADGAYFNVRSEDDESFLDEYQNVGGNAVATGKSYPSGSYVRTIAEYTALPFKTGKSYALHERVQLNNGDIVKSTVANNTNDPNVDMTGWLNLELDYKIRSGQVINLVADFGAVAGTDCTTNIYNAILEALRTGKALYIPSTAEPYLYRANQLTFYLDEVPLSEQKALFIYGDGEASVLKCMDGQINARYSLSLRFEPRASFKTFYFKDFRIDNNARGSTPPEEAFAYEQSPTISFAGGSAGVTIDSIIYENIVIEDPAADGWHHPLLGAITNITYINPIERGRTRVRSSIQEYYRARNVTIINPQLHSIETEAVASPPARSNINIIGGTTKNLDFTTAAYNDDVFIEITDHINTERFNCASMRSIKINGGEIRMNPDWARIQSCKNFKATNTLVKIPYNPITGACKSLMFYKGVGLKQTIEFNQSKFMLDYVGELPVAATGHLISGEGATAITIAEVANQEIFIRDCEFDERAFGSIDAYRIGTIVLENNKYGGIDHAIRWRNSAGAATDLTVIGGDFSKVQGSALSLGGSGASHKLTLIGEWVGAKAASHKMFAGALATSAPYIFNHRKIIADGLPTSALAKDIVCLGSIAATVGSVIEYQCTVSSATAPTFICAKQIGLYEAATTSLPVLTTNEKWARALDTTTNSMKTWTGTAWI